MKVYHGSTEKVSSPNLKYSKPHTDFGRGFYLTEDRNMACKWSASKAGITPGKKGILNEYVLDLEGLNTIRFGLTENWLDYVSANRNRKTEGSGYDERNLDVVIGPTADDKLYSTLKSYWSGSLTKEMAIKYLNAAGFSNQIALKSERAIRALTFMQCHEFSDEEREHWIKVSEEERKAMLERITELRRADSGTYELPPDTGILKPMKGDF